MKKASGILIKNKYPKFKLTYWRGKNKLHYTSNLKSRLLAKLNREKNVTKAFFTVVFAPDHCNESIDYQLPEQKEQMRKAYTLFTAKDEIDFQMKNL